MMEAHEGVRYLHIGCDEVYHIAACSLCSPRNPRYTQVLSLTRQSFSDRFSDVYQGCGGSGTVCMYCGVAGQCSAHMCGV